MKEMELIVPTILDEDKMNQVFALVVSAVYLV
jgi:hypothetical protein